MDPVFDRTLKIFPRNYYDKFSGRVVMLTEYGVSCDLKQSKS